MSGFNLRSIRTVDQTELAIKDPDGNPTGVVFVLAGPTHPVRKAIEQAKSRRLIAEANKTGRVKLPDPAEAEEQRPLDLAQCTLGWSGIAHEDGNQVPFSQAAAESLYRDPEMTWVTEQVEEALGNKALFTRRGAGS